jgi:hypothetical protein
MCLRLLGARLGNQAAFREAKCWKRPSCLVRGGAAQAHSKTSIDYATGVAESIV